VSLAQSDPDSVSKEAYSAAQLSNPQASEVAKSPLERYPGQEPSKASPRELGQQA
jgi:hypothetical protein